MARPVLPVLLACLVVAMPCSAIAGGGPLGIDHRVSLDERGIWARNDQNAVRNLSTIVAVGGALWEGNDTRLGRTFWKASESMVLADISAEALKRVFRRPRPTELNDPNKWFGSSSYHSFPSGEVAHITAVVTPFIVEYAHDTPAVWGLAVLPLYVGASRVKSQAHWQTDVLAGAALGAAIGSYEAGRQSAWSATVLPRGLTVGWRTRF